MTKTHRRDHQNRERLERALANTNPRSATNKRLRGEFKNLGSDYTMLMPTDNINNYYFASKVEGGAFGSIYVPDAYPLEGPVVKFLNPSVELDCSMQYSPACGLIGFIEAIIVSVKLPEFEYDNTEEVDVIFPFFFKGK